MKVHRTPPLSCPTSALYFSSLNILYFVFLSPCVLPFESASAPLSPEKEVEERNHCCLFSLCLWIPGAKRFTHKDKETEALKSTSHRQAFNKSFISTTLAIGELDTTKHQGKENSAKEALLLSGTSSPPCGYNYFWSSGTKLLTVVAFYHTLITWLITQPPLLINSLSPTHLPSYISALPSLFIHLLFLKKCFTVYR